MAPKIKREHEEQGIWDWKKASSISQSIRVNISSLEKIKNFMSQKEFDDYKKTCRSNQNDEQYLNATAERALDDAFASYFLKNPQHYYKIYYGLENLSASKQQEADEALVKKKIRALLLLTSWLHILGAKVDYALQLKGAFSNKDIDVRFLGIKKSFDAQGMSADESGNDPLDLFSIYKKYIADAKDELGKMPSAKFNQVNTSAIHKKQIMDTVIENPDAQRAERLMNSTQNWINALLNYKSSNNQKWQSSTAAQFNGILLSMHSYRKETNANLKEVIKRTAENAINTYFLHHPDLYHKLYHPNATRDLSDRALVERKILSIISLASWMQASGMQNIILKQRINVAFNQEVEAALINIKNEIEQKGIIIDESRTSAPVEIDMIFTRYYEKSIDEFNKNKNCANDNNDGGTDDEDNDRYLDNDNDDNTGNLNEIEKLRKENKELRDEIALLRNQVASLTKPVGKMTATSAAEMLMNMTQGMILTSTGATPFAPVSPPEIQAGEKLTIESSPKLKKKTG